MKIFLIRNESYHPMIREDCFARSMGKANPRVSYCCCRAAELRRGHPEVSQHDAFIRANAEWNEINAQRKSE